VTSPGDGGGRLHGMGGAFQKRLFWRQAFANTVRGETGGFGGAPRLLGRGDSQIEVLGSKILLNGINRSPNRPSTTRMPARGDGDAEGESRR